MKHLPFLIVLSLISLSFLTSCAKEDAAVAPDASNLVLKETCKVQTVKYDEDEPAVFTYNTAGKITSISNNDNLQHTFQHAGDSIVFLRDFTSIAPVNYRKEVCKIQDNKVVNIKTVRRELENNSGSIIETHTNLQFLNDANGRVQSIVKSSFINTLSSTGVFQGTGGDYSSVGTFTYNAQGALINLKLPSEPGTGNTSVEVSVTPSDIDARNARISVADVLNLFFNTRIVRASPLIDIGSKLVGKLAFKEQNLDFTTTYTYKTDSKGNVTTIDYVDVTPFGNMNGTITVAYSCP